LHRARSGACGGRDGVMIQVPKLVQNFDIKSRVYVLQTLTTFSLFLDVAGLLLHTSFTDS
jgi:hypothetical protein